MIDHQFSRSDASYVQYETQRASITTQKVDSKDDSKTRFKNTLIRNNFRAFSRKNKKMREN